MSTKIMGFVEGIGFAKNGMPELKILLKTNGALQSANELKPGDYAIEIKRPQSKRTLQQNAYLWEIIGQIDLKINGNRSEDEAIYCQMLEQAGQQVDFVQVTEEALPRLKQYFRVMYPVQTVTNAKGNRICTCKVYAGSSKFSKEEMSKLIDVALEWAGRYGLDVEYYKEMLFGEPER